MKKKKKNIIKKKQQQKERNTMFFQQQNGAISVKWCYNHETKFDSRRNNNKQLKHLVPVGVNHSHW